MMEEIFPDNGHDGRYRLLARAQDTIGCWRQFMEGMVSSKEIRGMQKAHTEVNGSLVSANKWAVELITKLLDATQGQLLYHNVQVHDKVWGT